ncbi:hypothetical protein CO608_07925 [Lysobacteraceae bacterium NML08-0793]|nr:hypothetical protein CO608_07925 [Xanthomonadaceae bacterium NML08-0793]
MYEFDNAQRRYFGLEPVGDDWARFVFPEGEACWPHEPQDRDVLYFLAQAFRARLLKTLPDTYYG